MYPGNYPLLLLSPILALGAKGPGAAAGSHVELTNRHYRIVLDRAKPGLVGLENNAMGPKGEMLPAPQPLFALGLREAEAAPGTAPPSWSLTSRDFSTSGLKINHRPEGTQALWELFWEAGSLRLRVSLDLQSDSTPESLWTVTLRANRDVNVQFTFPLLDGLQIGPRPQEAWYFHPRWCGLLNDTPIDLASVYGQYVRMPVMAAYHPSGAGEGRPGGLYLVTRDSTLTRKTFELVKRVKGAAPLTLRDEYGFPFWSGFQAQEGIGMAVSWLRLALRAGRSYRLSPVALGLGAGDWREALESYRQWARTWIPAHTRRARDCFQHVSFDLFSQPNCDAALAELDRHPYPDYMQFMVQKTHVNGEYGYRDDWGLAELQRFVREVQRRGIITNHYVEGYIAATGSRIWQEKGKEWGQMAGQEFQMAFANQCMWLGEPEWHRWLVGETTRLARDLRLDSIYLDEVGFGTGDKIASDNPHHRPGRLQPDGALVGVRDLLRVVRAGLDGVNPGISLYTEGPAVDGLFPYLDGVEDYSCWQGNSSGSLPPPRTTRR